MIIIIKQSKKGFLVKWAVLICLKRIKRIKVSK